MNTENIAPMSARDIIDDTIRYYQDGKHFGYSTQLSRCQYLVPETGNRCAVGRCLLTNRFDTSTQGVLSLMEPVPPHDRHVALQQDEFLPQYRGQRVGFWRGLQALHDAWACLVDSYPGSRERDIQLVKQALQDLCHAEGVEVEPAWIEAIQNTGRGA